MYIERVNASPARIVLDLSFVASKVPNSIRNTAIAQGFIESTIAAPIMVNRDSCVSSFFCNFVVGQLAP